MVQIDCKENGCIVSGDQYTFFFDPYRLSGRLSSHGGDVTILFSPRINGQDPLSLRLANIKSTHEHLTCDYTTDDARAMTLAIDFGNRGLVVWWEMDRVEDLAAIVPLVMEGEFLQLHNFTPDLSRVDIATRVVTPVHISSRLKRHESFFQLDQGNYMMPPYLFALCDRKVFLGLGLLEIPDTHLPIDCDLRLSSAELRFVYGPQKKTGHYTTPRVCLFSADSRDNVLLAYRSFFPRNRAPTPAWWLNPVYTTWGDQVYAKHIEEGNFTTEAGSDRFLSGDLIDKAIERLRSKSIHPKTLILDEGWSVCVGDWTAEDRKFGGSLREYIGRKQAEGYRVALQFNPFLVEQSCAALYGDNLVKKASDTGPTVIDRSGRSYHAPDWSCAEVREYFRGKINHLLAASGLNADGIKIVGTKYTPGPEEQSADPSYGVYERYLFAVLRDIHDWVKAIKPDAFISLACVNPLFESVFDIVRVGNTSEVNHDLHVLRANTAARLLPGKPIDTDDWAAYGKVIGATTFIKSVAGIPNIFSAFYRGDGRFRVQGASGGSPMSMEERHYRVLAAAQKLYRLSMPIPRDNLVIDYDRMEFHAGQPGIGVIRTYLGGNALAVEQGLTITAVSLHSTTAIVDVPAASSWVVEEHDDTGAKHPIEYTRYRSNKIAFKITSILDRNVYYTIRGVN